MTLLPRFENMMSWGNVITLIAMAGGGLMAFSSVQSEVKYMQGIMEEIQQDRQEDEIRIRALELGVGRIEERLISINSTLIRIDQNLNGSGGR